MSLLVKNLTVSRQQKIIFENLSFKVNAGELFLIVGANGSGKTTLLKTMAGLNEPLHGEIRWQQQTIPADNFYQELHFVGHTNGLKHSLTVAENLKLLQIFTEKNIPDCHDTLVLLQLEKLLTTPVALLSQGQKRRLGLAKLFLSAKKLWLLDEPLTALDQHTQQIFLQHLIQHLHTDGICVLSSHDASLFQAHITNTVRL